MTVYGVKAGPPPTDHRPVATACTLTDAGAGDCTTDGDCGASSEVCACEPTGARCVSSLCHVDGDCGRGGYCSPSYSVTIGCNLNGTPTSRRGLDGFFCHTAADQCNNDADCASGETCTWAPEQPGRWICYSPSCSG